MALKSKQKPTNVASRSEYQPLNITSMGDIQNNDEREMDQQGNKIVEINRLLSADQYGVGKQLQDFKEKFMEDLAKDVEFKNPSKYVDPG
jgi:hypothetical protein